MEQNYINSSSAKPPILTVSLLNQMVQQLLLLEVGKIWISGEISNFSQPASGHWYFTLKDEQSQIRCAMFNHRNRQLISPPCDGQQFLIHALVSLYQSKGEYQLIVESLQPLGDGLLRQRFEQVKQQLAAEGLFKIEHKQPMPRYPKCIGIITSSSGAVLYDILHVLKRRDPSLKIIIYPSLVQGNEAPEQLINAIYCATTRNECDILIIARGGGSLEDLWAFNDSSLARAIFACPIPTVSAIGHETDLTIADLVADQRAPTPSAAAELVSRDQQEIYQQLNNYQKVLFFSIKQKIIRTQTRSEKNRYQLYQYHPQVRLIRRYNQLLQLQKLLQDACLAKLQDMQKKYYRLQQQLYHLTPLTNVHINMRKVQTLLYYIKQAVLKKQNMAQQQLIQLGARLDCASPLAILARGFTMTTDLQGNTVRNFKQINLGEFIQTRFIDGYLRSTIIEQIPL